MELNFEQYQDAWVERFDQIASNQANDVVVVVDPEIEELVNNFQEEVRTTTPLA